MSSAATDKLFWLAYCKAIQQAIGASPGKDSALSFATRVQKGPMASTLIPDVYTNDGIYHIGDNLLAADNLFYVPSNQNSYIRSLYNYLGYVDLGGNPSEASLTRLVTARTAADAATVNSDRESDKAYAQFEKNQKRGMTGNLTFAQWFPTNCPGYVEALRQTQEAYGRVKMAANDAYGPLADQYNADVDKINAAKTTINGIPGLNMGATGASPATAQEILNANNRGEKIPDPTGVRFVPAYYCPEYVRTAEDWLQTPANGRLGKQSLSIKMEQGEQVDESEFGHVSGGGGVRFSYIPWVSFGVGGSYDRETHLRKSDLTDNDVEIVMHYDEMTAVPIQPGDWNIGDPRSSYPNLKPNAPLSAKILVAPSQIMLVKNLSYTVNFSGEVKSEFDKKVTETITADGYVRIFGIPIKVGGDFRKSTEHTSHVATWDKNSGSFEVVPTDDGAFASVVAILGDKIKTT